MYKKAHLTAKVLIKTAQICILVFRFAKENIQKCPKMEFEMDKVSKLTDHEY